MNFEVVLTCAVTGAGATTHISPHVPVTPEEIAREGIIRVRRPNREFLLDIRRGAFEYEQLVSWAEERMARIEDCYAQSLLPEEPDVDKINRILIEMREELYG